VTIRFDNTDVIELPCKRSVYFNLHYKKRCIHETLTYIEFENFFCKCSCRFCFSVSADPVDADTAKAFAKQNNCLRCHGVDKDKDGPAFTKVAAKFKADAKAEERLLKHLSSGEKPNSLMGMKKRI
jgi:Cytochrome c551/c552